MVSASTLYTDVLVTNRSHTFEPEWSGRSKVKMKKKKKKQKAAELVQRKDVCLLRGFEAKEAEVAVPSLAVQLGTALRKAQSLVNVGGGVDFIQANMFLDPAHLN